MAQDINKVLIEPFSQPYTLLYYYDYVWRDDVEKYKEVIQGLQGNIHKQ